MTTAVLARNEIPAFVESNRPSMSTLTKVETRKMVDTRAGKWLLGLTLATAPIAATIAIFVVDASSATFDDFYSNIAGLQGILLPVLGVLVVTSEWGQRTALTTFTLEPNRMRVIVAKFLAAVILTAVVLVFAAVVSAIYTELAVLLKGTDNAWNLGIGGIAEVALAQLTSTIQGVAFGALILISAAAIVALFALPTIWAIFGGLFSNVMDVARWVDLGTTSENLTTHDMTGRHWAQFLVSMVIWVGVPIVVGTWRLNRAEVK